MLLVLMFMGAKLTRVIWQEKLLGILDKRETTIVLSEKINRGPVK